MTEENCVFCKIVKGEIPSYKIWENSKYMAMLDIYPNIKGQTLVIPKEHMGSDAFKMDSGELASFMKAVKRVANNIEKKMGIGRVHLVFEGTAIDHLHAKLYPAVGYGKEFVETIAPDKVFFESYPGYVTTLMGPRANDEELKKLQKLLKAK